jgi:hypothetical protein
VQFSLSVCCSSYSYPRSGPLSAASGGPAASASFLFRYFSFFFFFFFFCFFIPDLLLMLEGCKGAVSSVVQRRCAAVGEAVRQADARAEQLADPLVLPAQTLLSKYFSLKLRADVCGIRQNRCGKFWTIWFVQFADRFLFLGQRLRKLQNLNLQSPRRAAATAQRADLMAPLLVLASPKSFQSQVVFVCVCFFVFFLFIF